MQNQLFDKKEFSSDFLAKIQKFNIKHIKLPTRAINIIKSKGIENSIDAIMFVINDFSKLPNIGIKTISQSQKAVYKFINILETTSVENIDKILDPREEYFCSESIRLSETFSDIVELYLKRKSKKNYIRDKNIIEKRFELNGSKKYTLEEIGLYYNLTRERVRQIQSKIINEIRQLLKGELNTKQWKINKNLENEYERINTKIKLLGGIVIEQSLKLNLPNFKSEYLNLFMSVLGYIKIPDSFIGFRGTIQNSWHQNEMYSKRNIQSIFLDLNFILDNPIKLSIFDVIVSIKRKKVFSNETIYKLLALINEIEISDDSIQVKFNSLSNTNKTFRLLHENNKPMHFLKIAKIINSKNKGSNFKILTVTNLINNQLVPDKRFMPIGKSGNWALKNWKIDNITIVEAIRIVLHKNGKPMYFDDLSKQVYRLRPDASTKSLTAYLNDKKLFARVDTKIFALNEWKLTSKSKHTRYKTISVSEFNNVIKSAFITKNLITFPNLISIVSKKLGVSEATARQRILSTQGLKVRPVKGKKYKEVFCSNIDLIKEKFQQSQNTLRDEIQSEIREILYANPNVPIKKGELYKLVLKKINCLKPTFYQYLSIMDDVIQYIEENNYYVVYQKP